jgi:hypothetical protein
VRSDYTAELIKIIERWRTAQGTEPQFITIVSSYQNRATEYSIEVAEASIYAILNNTRLLLEFWDKAVKLIHI